MHPFSSSSLYKNWLAIMGMPCEVNSILKLKPSQGYPEQLVEGTNFHATKEGYRIIPVDIPIPLVDKNWVAYADIVITRLIWQQGNTEIDFIVDRLYKSPFLAK